MHHAQAHPATFSTGSSAIEERVAAGVVGARVLPVVGGLAVSARLRTAVLVVANAALVGLLISIIIGG